MKQVERSKSGSGFIQATGTSPASEFSGFVGTPLPTLEHDLHCPDASSAAMAA